MKKRRHIRGRRTNAQQPEIARCVLGSRINLQLGRLIGAWMNDSVGGFPRGHKLIPGIDVECDGQKFAVDSRSIVERLESARRAATSDARIARRNGGDKRERFEPADFSSVEPAKADTLIQQAANNMKGSANSPDLETEIVSAIMEELEAHTVVSAQARGPESVAPRASRAARRVVQRTVAVRA